MVKRLFLDTTPLRESREFRLLYIGQMVSFFGRQLTVVAIPVQVYAITESSLMIGLVSFAQLIPLIVFSLVGGAIADAFDRRKLLLIMQLVLAATSVGLAINAMSDEPAVWPLFVFSAAAAGLSGIDSPTRSASIPSLVRRELLPSAYALNQTLMQVGQVAGPAAAGLIIARVSLAATYWLDAATFAIAFATVFAMAPLVPEGGGTRPGFASVAEGVRFLKSRRILQSTFLIDLNAMIFGMPRALFPALAATTFAGSFGLENEAVAGLLFAAPGAGALLGALTTGWVSSVRRHGRAVLIAVAAWGAAIAGFGLTDSLPLALALLALAGAADVVSAVFRNTMLQIRVPDRLRGRLSAIHIAVVTGGPRLGDLEAGAVAAATSPAVSVVSGGLACIAGVGLLALTVPQFSRATRDPAEDEEDVDDVDPEPVATAV